MFNNLYTNVIPFDDFMPDNGSNWKDTKTIIDNVRAAIVNKLTSAVIRTRDKSIISPLIQNARLLYFAGSTKTSHKKLQSAKDFDVGLKALIHKQQNPINEDSLTFIITLQTNN